MLRQYPFSLNIIEERLYKDGQLVDLTPTEYMILQYLMNQASKPVSRDEILNMIWGTNYVGETKVVDVNMRRLRQKIECNPSEPEFILTVWGKGYVEGKYEMKRKVTLYFMTVITLMLVLFEVVFSVSIYRYYYNGIVQYIESHAKTSTRFFQNTIHYTLFDYKNIVVT